MDNLKDNKWDTYISSLIDTPYTNPFGQNRNGERMYRRLENIVAAIFALTSHIDGVGLSAQLRLRASSLLELFMDAIFELRNASSVRKSSLLASMRHCVSLIRLLALDGSISKQNNLVVIAAIEDFCYQLHMLSKSPLSEEKEFTKDDFALGQQAARAVLKDKKDNAGSTLLKGQVVNSRSSSILSVFPAGKEMSIREIAAEFPDLGEKTLQRELARLVLQGLVRRVGARRWSKYSIISANNT